MKHSLFIPKIVHDEIMFYIDKAPGEISGFGTLTFDKQTGRFEIHQVVLCEQENTGGSTDMKAEDVAKAMFQLKDAPGELRWWWHSHVDFNVFWSGTDKKTMAELAHHGWFLSTVFNKKRENKTCLTFRDGNFGLFEIDNMETVVEKPVYDAELVNKWTANYDKKVKEKIVIVPAVTKDWGAYYKANPVAYYLDPQTNRNIRVQKAFKAQSPKLLEKQTDRYDALIDAQFGLWGYVDILYGDLFDEKGQPMEVADYIAVTENLLEGESDDVKPNAPN